MVVDVELQTLRILDILEEARESLGLWGVAGALATEIVSARVG